MAAQDGCVVQDEALEMEDQSKKIEPAETSEDPRPAVDVRLLAECEDELVAVFYRELLAGDGPVAWP